MSNAVLIGFDSTGAARRIRNRLGTDLTNDEPIQAGEVAAIRTTLLGSVGGLVYLGPVAGNAVPSVPTPSTGGVFYMISAGGTSQGKTWGIGDLAIYLGSSGQWQQVKANSRSVNVEDYGAVGDGVADDTAAIQLAAAVVQAIGGGALVFGH